MFTVSQAYALALQHQQAGRLAAAEALYRQILTTDPNHAEAWHSLGLVVHQSGRSDIAVEMIRRALALNPNDAAAHSNLGLLLGALGRRDEALAEVRQAVALQPGSAEMRNNLGNALKECGLLESAIAAYRKAIALNPNSAEAHSNLGNALRENGDFDDAIQACQRALRLKPDLVEAHSNLGTAFRHRKQPNEAVAAYREALRLNPNLAVIHYNLGVALADLGQFEEAIAEFRRALDLKPDSVEARIHLGSACRNLGRLDEAIGEYRRTLELDPRSAEAHNNLGLALHDRGQFEQAEAAYRRALEIKPDYAEVHNNLGIVLQIRDKLEDAAAAYRRALELKPDYAEAHNNLGSVFKSQGRLDEAVASYQRAVEFNRNYAPAHGNLGAALKDRAEPDAAIAAMRRALELNPACALTQSSLLYTLHFLPGRNDELIAEARARWNRAFDAPAGRSHEPHTNDRNPERRLRIGYVSPDFRNQVVGRNLTPLFRCHEHRAFEIFCYSGVTAPDSLTQQLQSQADRWRNTIGLTDEALAETIRQDGIDILVDLSQHLAGNRLTMFAHRPAPVQVSFAGYPESTGVEAIGYRISDRYLECAMRSEIRNEHIFLLDSFWCYDPCGLEVPVNGLPAKENGHVTFGSLNNFCKVNEPLLRLWARVLRAVQDSRLVLLSGFGSHRLRTIEFLEREGIPAHRVEFVESRPRKEYLESYHRLDVVLDPFPYNGHTTSLDALWMGVPAVSLAGECPASRAGFSQLSNLGLLELVAHSEDEYVEIATRLASDNSRLAELRRTLRQRMEGSVLMDAPRFTRGIEAAFRAMWRHWCAATPA